MTDRRNYGIDFLRIFSMLLVLLLHILGAGGVLSGTQPLSGNYATAWLLETAAYCAVNCYALISGFVGYRSKTKYTNLALLWIQVVLVSVAVNLGFWIADPSAFDTETLLRSFFPVLNNYGWYFTCYFALFFFMPLLNHAICTMKERELKILCGSWIGVLSILGTASLQDIFQLQDGYSVLWLGALYLLGGCIGRFGWFRNISKPKLLLIYGGSILLAWGTKLILETISSPTVYKFTYSEVLIRYKSPTILIAAVALLLLFSSLNLPKILKITVKFLAPAAFGVYIIHMHPKIWNTVIVGKFAPLATDGICWMILKTLGTVLILYLAFSLLDLLRHWLFRGLKLKERLSAFEEKIRNRDSGKEKK